MYGYHHPGDAIGPEPSHQAPDQRAAWHQAFAALGAVRADAEAAAARKADDHDRAARHEQLAAGYRHARPLPATRAGPRPGHG